MSSLTVDEAVQEVYSVLLVDDDPDFQQLIALYLRHEPGLSLFCCTDPTVALTEAVRLHPDVVLLDQVMPSLSGIEVLRQLRQHGATRMIPVVMLSGQDESQFKAHVFAQGANDYLTKIPDRIELVARLYYHAAAYHNRRQRHQNEMRYRALFEHSFDAIYLVDATSHTIVDCNAAALYLVQQQKERVIGHPFGDLFATADQEQVIATIQNQACHTDLHIRRCGDDQAIPVELSATTINLPDQRIWQVILRNILQRRQSEAALKRSQQSLAKAQQIAHLGSWEWDILKNSLTWSDETYRIFGWQPQCWPMTYSRFIQMVHPDDRARLADALDRTLSHPELPYSVEHRIICDDGSERVVHEQGEVVRCDDRGYPVRMIGTIHNITERREAEKRLEMAARIFNEAISEAEDHLQITTKVFDHAVESVVVTTIDFVIHSVNPAFTTITGYHADDVIGRNIQFLYCDPQEPLPGAGAKLCQLLTQHLQQQEQWRGENWAWRQNGEIYPEMTTVTVVRDRQNQPTHLVFVSQDMTDVKRNQEALRFQTYHDQLTRLPNRTLFKDRLEQAVRAGQRNHEK
ncbi:MAG: PAS domain S-box protein [Magnetococcales bacterium]|nr:PAS domain S-box protein [Magnetococcales bacterium]